MNEDKIKEFKDTDLFCNETFKECLKRKINININSKTCKLHKVKVRIETEEPGMCFEEEIVCGPDGEVKYEEIDMPEYTCSCGSKQSFARNADLKEEMCYECEKTGEWTKNEN